jgi:hypothetical protein
LFADRFTQSCVGIVEALGVDYAARDIVGRSQCPACRSERIHDEPRQLVARKVPNAPRIGALRSYVSRIAIGLKQPQDAIDVRQVSTVLFQLAFQLFDEPSNECPLLAKGGNDMPSPRRAAE